MRRGEGFRGMGDTGTFIVRCLPFPPAGPSDFSLKRKICLPRHAGREPGEKKVVPRSGVEEGSRTIDRAWRRHVRVGTPLVPLLRGDVQ